MLFVRYHAFIVTLSQNQCRYKTSCSTMKRLFLTLLLLIPIMTLWAQEYNHTTSHRLDRGISIELARERKKEIEDLHYALRFDLPLRHSEAVKGSALIVFQLRKRQEVVLDFKAEEGNIVRMEANGRETSYEWKNEHIVLPREVMRKGKNEIKVDFIAPDQSLNRNEDYLYTLLVPDRARTLFPCFEQPNLKARFTLTLEMPVEWKAVSNTAVAEQHTEEGRTTIRFAETEPLSTYLFSFVAGRMNRSEWHEDDRTIVAYYRETDSAKVAQLPDIFRQVVASMRWMEQYTAIPYPFSKYDFVILPGFQYGGMEHVGATLYNDRSMFLSPNATPDEQLNRLQLIGHEVAHLWFGDLVTMDWFDDVWIKEVFANYFGLRISEPLFPHINHRLNWLKSYTAPAQAEDRTAGTTPIRQQLSNLQDGGLIYGNIVYDKAPVMLEKLAELMGEADFREGLREYLHTYAYANASWDDLIATLNRHTERDLTAFSQAWVYKKGLPIIQFRNDGHWLHITQWDAEGRLYSWPQKMQVRLTDGLQDTTLSIELNSDSQVVHCPFVPTRIIPNSDGHGYGLFLTDSVSTAWLLAHWSEISDETARLSALMLLNEMYQHQLSISPNEWIQSLIKGLGHEFNALIASSVVGYLYSPLSDLTPEECVSAENQIMTLSQRHDSPSCRTQLLRLLMTEGRAAATTDGLYTLWNTQSSSLLSEDDYTTLAFELAVRLPEMSDSILARQRQRISNPDRTRRFDFIARATVADEASRDSLFAALLLPENRRVEPWAATALYYLNHPLRQTHAVRYLRPALEVLEDVQRTGDIFFPRNWVGSLLRGHRSPEAYREVKSFVATHPNYPPMLLNKLLQAAYSLYRANENVKH